MNDKPVRPDNSDCCGSGCKPCIFDVYEERLKKWESKQENFIDSKALDQIKYLPFLITNIEVVEELLRVFQFQAVTLKAKNSNLIQIKSAVLGTEYEILNEFLNIKSGEYLIMKGIYGAEIISRPYTPVLNKNHFAIGAFKVIISLQVNGKMSEFIKNLQTHDIVFWRGPYQEFAHDFKSFKHTLLFGGGTGIVPLYNIAKTIVEDEEMEMWVSLCASFKSTRDIILRRELGILKDFWNFKMKTYITNQNQFNFRPNYNESIIFRKIDETVIKEEVSKCGEDKYLVLVSGPEGFNHFIKDNLKKIGVKSGNIFIFW